MIESIKPEIIDLVENRKWSTLRSLLSSWEIPEIVDLINSIDSSDRVLLFRSLPRGIIADVFAYLDHHDQDQLLQELTSSETRHILATISPDDRTLLLEELPPEVTQKLMSLLNYEDLKEARFLLGYPEESVGRLMTPDYIAVNSQTTVNQAIEQIRLKGRDSETVNRIYICNEHGKLLDDIVLRKLIIAPGETRLDTLMDYSFISLSAFDDREEAVKLMAKYDIIALPVVDSGGVLIGIVTVDDVMDVAEKEVTEDIHKAASVSPLKESYRHASVFTLYNKRIVWLVILVVVNLVSSGIIAFYEEALAAAISLTFFIPLLLGSGGNAGAQAATLMLRALVTGDITMREWFGSILKELAVGTLLGVSLGVVSLGLGLIYSGFTIGLILGITMAFTVVAANLVGMLLPFLLAQLKFDPAVASSPLITTIADATGLLIYFTTATWLLQL